jgi:hypothetical protein
VENRGNRKVKGEKGMNKIGTGIVITISTNGQINRNGGNFGA